MTESERGFKVVETAANLFQLTSSLEGGCNMTREDIDALYKTVEEIAKECSALEDEVAALEARVTELEARVVELEGEGE